MTLEIHLHSAQTSILRELLFRKEANFAALQKPTGLTSDHFTFHIKKLTELGLVRKAENKTYALTTRGKEYANKLDTDNNTIERQPKVAVLMAIQREKDGVIQYVFQERLKHPYYNYYGFPTGKIRWGETILETAARELKEETNLEAKLEYLGVYHEHTYSAETNELLEDKIFHAVLCTNTTGPLLEEFEGGRNAWFSPAEMEGKKVFKSFETELRMLNREINFVEVIQTYSADEF